MNGGNGYNITKFDNCFGCGVCIAACPINIIELAENDDGFYHPVIADQDKCIKCGICLKVCSFNHSDVASSDTANDDSASYYAGWSKDPLVRQWCSSGGIGYEIGQQLIKQGYTVCAVRYNIDKQIAEHYISHTTEEFMQSVGSKYIPSYSSKAFSEINRKQKNLVIGTPCQIDSFRRYIRHYKVEDNFILIDFFCHGVPSLQLWKVYLNDIRESIGDVSFVSWRNKNTGWHDFSSMDADNVNIGDSESIPWKDSYNLKIKGKRHLYISGRSQGDLFYKLFLGNYCLNICCYKNCKYKCSCSAADIRLGDLWGHKYAYEDKGVSGIIVFSKRARSLLENLDNCELIPESKSVVAEGQMKKKPSIPFIRNYVIRLLRDKIPLHIINIYYIRPYELLIKLPIRVINKIFRLTHISYQIR